MDAKAQNFSQLLALEAALVTAGTSTVAFQPCFMAGRHFSMPDLLEEWQISLDSGNAEMSNLLANTNCRFEKNPHGAIWLKRPAFLTFSEITIFRPRLKMLNMDILKLVEKQLQKIPLMTDRGYLCKLERGNFMEEENWETRE